MKKFILAIAIAAGVLFSTTSLVSADSASWKITYGCGYWQAELSISRTTSAKKLMLITEGNRVVSVNYVSGLQPTHRSSVRRGTKQTVVHVYVYAQGSGTYNNPPALLSNFTPTNSGLVLHEGRLARAPERCTVPLASRSV